LDEQKKLEFQIKILRDKTEKENRARRVVQPKKKKKRKMKNKKDKSFLKKK
jgi:hypothetical protein